ncbi:MAG: class I SAM-dependent methyltransferase [Dongiaceae bacterium]
MTLGRRARAFRRRLGLGLPTVLGLARRGFFIPYRHAGAVTATNRAEPYPAVAARFAAETSAMAALLDRLGEFAGRFAALAAGAADSAARFDQDWFPRLDAAMAYGLLRWRRPQRIVEVGSGHSTRFLAAAIADGGLDCRLTAIDPAPRADLARLPIHQLRALVPGCGPAPFAALGAGDLLSIDSSHVLMPGTDVDFLLTTVLPRLEPGTLVHIHDMFLPDDYPAAWSWRGYNEQSGVAALLAGGGWTPLFSSRWAVTRMGVEVAQSAAGRLPLRPGALESSLWLERRR